MNKSLKENSIVKVDPRREKDFGIKIDGDLTKEFFGDLLGQTELLIRIVMIWRK